VLPERRADQHGDDEDDDDHEAQHGRTVPMDLPIRTRPQP
jgi:hypothetical protein